ncbi:MAG TPA: aspartate aminotransferase family protein [Trinickia sp.]|uniref:aspartate aminotransferase family protein n=1 Tax=Trinickia sp. TaxID=2571163 RepID=UPI002BD65346|nr:aspartate aminotransferase family protein [Trinickia sp.]HVW51968.1 aspartate aminotransferase family protein [Trinickia sp.]
MTIPDQTVDESSDAVLLARRHRLLGRSAPLFYDTPLHIVSARDVWMYDAQGRAYLDAYNNVPVVGHCHPRVVTAIADQATRLNVHSRYLHETVLDYAERLTATFDAVLDMVILTCTGSEANDVALQIARQHTGGLGIVCTNQTYHGNTTAVRDLSTLFSDGESRSPLVRPVTFPNAYRPLRGLSGQALVDAHIEEIVEQIGAFKAASVKFAGMLACPIFANEGLPNVPEGYWPRVAQIVREAGGLLIFDEVQAGFGRTGHMWGQQRVGVVPDIVTLGKPMGNGYPIAGVVSRAELIEPFRDEVMYFNTFGATPVACAAALAVLDVIAGEALIDNARTTGQCLADGMRALQSRHPLIGDVRSQGLFLAVELVEDRETKAPAGRLAKLIVNDMKTRGVLISRVGQFDNILKIRPPLPFRPAHADHLLNTFDDCLTALKDAAR